MTREPKQEGDGLVESADVVVVGAGVVGCSVAYYLAREGVIKVFLLEREAIGSGASAHATGSLSLLGAEFSPGASFEMARASYAEFPDLVSELESATGNGPAIPASPFTAFGPG